MTYVRGKGPSFHPDHCSGCGVCAFYCPSNSKPLSLAALTRVLKSLLLDGISLRHALRIFSSLSQAAQQTAEHDRLIDLIRADLGSMLVHQQ